MTPVNQNRNDRRTAPRDRQPIHYEQIACFGHHGPHYFGYHVHALPPHCVHHHYWGHDYWFYDGIYYRCWDGRYYVSRPPYGYWFERTAYELELIACRIAYYSTLDRIYDTVDENYRTITEQNRIIAENNATIAAQNAAIASGQQLANGSYELARRLGLVQSFADASLEYYYDDGIFFILKNGKYVTIVPPAGAIVEKLPEDYETIVLGGQEYYNLDDTVFRVIISEGKALFEVLGQLPS